MSNETTHTRMRTYHRYLGYFLAGIMTMYALSGFTLIFRDTGFLKREKQVEKQLKPNLKNEELGRELRMRELKIDKEEGDILSFRNGTYNKATGVANYTTKELPWLVDKLTRIHKADTKNPLFFLNIFFASSLLFFVVSSFWMYMPKTSIFKKGLYFALAGMVLVLLLIII